MPVKTRIWKVRGRFRRSCALVFVQSGTVIACQRNERFRDHRVFIHRIQRESAVLGTPFQQPLALQKTGNAMCDGMGELCQFVGALTQ